MANDNVPSKNAKSSPSPARPASEHLPDTRVVGQSPPDTFTPEPAPPSGGKTFGNYQIVQELGRGGMGVVYKAQDPRLGRIVAIKTLLVEDDAEGSKTKRFFREAQTVAKLHHPNVIQVYDIGQESTTPFFVMEFVEGETLEKKIGPAGMDVTEALKIMEVVASAVAYVHSQKIIHRDLKPGNIMSDKHGTLKVMDFGLTKPTESGSKLSQEGLAVGTLGYIPPEQFDGKAEERSDVYALGVILYQMLTGVMPFEGDSIHGVLWKQLQAPAIPPSQKNPQVSKDVDTIVLKAFEYEKEHRYPSAQALAEDIRRVLNQEPILARPVRFHERMWRKARRNPKVAAVVVLSLVMAIAGLVAVLSPRVSLLEILKNQEAIVEQLGHLPKPQATELITQLTTLLDHPQQKDELRARTLFFRGKAYKRLANYDAAKADFRLAAAVLNWEHQHAASQELVICDYIPFPQKLQQQEENLSRKSKLELEQLAQDCADILGGHYQTPHSLAYTHFVAGKVQEALARQQDVETGRAYYQKAVEEYEAAQDKWPHAPKRARICKYYRRPLAEIIEKIEDAILKRALTDGGAPLADLKTLLELGSETVLTKIVETLLADLQELLGHPQTTQIFQSRIRLLRARVFDFQKQPYPEEDFQWAQKKIGETLQPEDLLLLTSLVMKAAFQKQEWDKCFEYFRSAYQDILIRRLNKEAFRPIAQIFFEFMPELVAHKEYPRAMIWLDQLAKAELCSKKDTDWKYWWRVNSFWQAYANKNDKYWKPENIANNFFIKDKTLDMAPADVFAAYIMWRNGDVDNAKHRLRTAKGKEFTFAQHQECQGLLQDSKFAPLLQEAQLQDK